MESLLRCPLCAQPLDRQDTRYLCPRGHSFDRAAAGYVHLLPANKLHSKDPGDDKAMAAARNRFLSGGYYDPLRDALTRLALAYAPDRAQILDAGCGEGYYSAALFQALLQAGKHPRMAGVDLSKHALRRAAKRQGSIEFAVASVYDLPVADQQIDLLVNCFSPLALEEFLRVLRPGGLYCYVVPGARHLWELKQVLYDTPYPNEEKETPYPGLSYPGHPGPVSNDPVLLENAPAGRPPPVWAAPAGHHHLFSDSRVPKAGPPLRDPRFSIEKPHTALS